MWAQSSARFARRLGIPNQFEHNAGIGLAFGRTCHGECSVGAPYEMGNTHHADVLEQGDAHRVSRYYFALYSAGIMRIARGLVSAPNGCIAGGPAKRCCWACCWACCRARGDQIDRQSLGHQVALEAWVRCPACLPRRLQPCFASSCNEAQLRARHEVDGG